MSTMSVSSTFHHQAGGSFLETHHIVPLGQDGNDTIENTIALCPNCHRKMHALNLENDRDSLIRMAKSEWSMLQ